MDDYQDEKNAKKELAEDSANANAKITDTSSILDVSQTIQQLLAMSSIASGAILSPMQLLQASASSGANASQLSLPWIVPHHYQQMMILQQGLTQPFLMSDVVDDKDGHVIVVPTNDQMNQYNNMSVISSVDDLPSGQTGVPSAPIIGSSDSSVSRLKTCQMNATQKPAVKDSIGTTHLMSSVDCVTTKRGMAQHGQLHADSAKMPRPPKKPLTPYMLFSKEIWHQVKAANSHLSLVTEIGAIIGSMWRELDAEKKEHYNELFSRDKIRYDEEIRLYLKNHNMHPSDLIRARLSKKKDSKCVNQHRPPAASHAATILNPPGQQLVQSLLGYPVVDGSQALISVDGGTLPNSLMQAWAGQPIQQILAQIGLTGHLMQANGDDVQMNEAETTGQQQQQQQLHAVFSNASVCGSSENLAQSTAAQSSDSSPDISHLIAESISAADKSKSWLWSTGQPTNSSSSIRDNYVKSTNHGPAAASASAAGMKDQPMASHSLDTNNKTTVYSGDISDWSEAKCNRWNGKSEEIQQLESRLLYLESALSEKNKEIEKLVNHLEKAHQVISNFRIKSDIAEARSLELNCGANGTVV